MIKNQLNQPKKHAFFVILPNGIQEVRGSTPLISTTAEKNEPDFIGFFFFSGALRGDAVPPAA